MAKRAVLNEIKHTEFLLPARTKRASFGFWDKVSTFVQISTAPIFYVLFRLLTKFEVKGQENLRGFEDRSVIFASNHADRLDGPICGSALPRFYDGRYSTRFFPIRFLAHREYFTGKNAIIFPFNYFAILYVRANGCIPVEKAGGDLAKALGEAVRVLNTGGENFWIYPEGVMSRDGDLHQGKRGVAYLHQQTNVPIVPVGIRGNFRAFKLKNLILRRSKITLVFGKPIYSLPSKTLEEGANFVMERIAELTGQTYDPNNK